MSDPTKWEYQQVTLDEGEPALEEMDDAYAETVLDRYGRDGWELVRAARDCNCNTVLTFKRPRS